MKTIIIKGLIFSSVSLTGLDYVARGYMYARGEVLGSVNDLTLQAVDVAASRFGLELRAKQDPETLKDLVTRKAIEHGLTPTVAHALVSQESSYDPTAISEVGAIGLAQVMPFHYKTCKLKHPGELKDPETNLDCGFSIFRTLLDRLKDPHKAIQAYFGGDQCVNNAKCPKTLKYVTNFLTKLVRI